MKNDWNPALFSYHGGYLHYNGQFIARFRTAKGPFNYHAFKRQLIKSFSPESYLAKRAEGLAPLDVLRLDDLEWFNETVTKWKIKQGVAP